MFSEKAVTALDCVLLKDRNLALTPRQGPKINSRACLWVSPRPRHHIKYWLTNQRLILLHISCLETPKAGSGPTNFRIEPTLASWSAISLPRTPACPETRCSPTACGVEISFNTFWHCWANGDIVLMAWRAFKAAWLSESIHGTASVIHMIINVLSKVHINNNSKIWIVRYKNIPSQKVSWLCCLFEITEIAVRIVCTHEYFL